MDSQEQKVDTRCMRRMNQQWRTLLNKFCTPVVIITIIIIATVPSSLAPLLLCGFPTRGPGFDIYFFDILCEIAPRPPQ